MHCSAYYEQVNLASQRKTINKIEKSQQDNKPNVLHVPTSHCLNQKGMFAHIYQLSIQYEDHLEDFIMLLCIGALFMLYYNIGIEFCKKYICWWDSVKESSS